MITKESIKEKEDWLKSVFPNWKDGMYAGNIPAGKGHQRVLGGYFDRWETAYGGGESYDNEINVASFSVNRKVTIDIVGSSLFILDIRYAGKTDFWEYSNDEKCNMPGYPCCRESSRHKLEAEKIENILNTKIPDCKFWDIVQKKAKELYYESRGK